MIIGPYVQLVNFQLCHICVGGTLDFKWFFSTVASKGIQSQGNPDKGYHIYLGNRKNKVCSISHGANHFLDMLPILFLYISNSNSTPNV